MNSSKMRLSLIYILFVSASLVGCGSIEQAARDDCTSIGWEVGSKGYQDCYQARIQERKFDYSSPQGGQPPSSTP